MRDNRHQLKANEQSDRPKRRLASCAAHLCAQSSSSVHSQGHTEPSPCGSPARRGRALFAATGTPALNYLSVKMLQSFSNRDSGRVIIHHQKRACLPSNQLLQCPSMGARWTPTCASPLRTFRSLPPWQPTFSSGITRNSMGANAQERTHRAGAEELSKYGVETLLTVSPRIRDVRQASPAAPLVAGASGRRGRLGRPCGWAANGGLPWRVKGDKDFYQEE
jgi:hypothetical protein